MTEPRTLFSLIAWQILAIAFAAMVIQFVLVFHDYWGKPEELSRKLVELETGRLLEDLNVSSGIVTFTPSPSTLEQFPQQSAEASAKDFAPAGAEDDAPATYFARVRSMNGSVLFSNCSDECDEHFVPLSLTPPDFWLKMIDVGRPLTFAGGQSFEVSGQTVAVEFASIRDPGGKIWGVLIHEIVDHMVVPMFLMLVMIIGVTVLSVRLALRPVSLAVKAADRLNPQRTLNELPTKGMPREIAILTQATNRALTRAKQSMASQKLFASAIAHEIRTPVSVVQLELEQIDHPRATKALADLHRLTQTLEALTALARLDAISDPELTSCDLSDIATALTASLAPLVFANGKTIAYENHGNTAVFTAPALVENLISNIVENAAKHAVPGSSITVYAGPGARITVSDEPPARAKRMTATQLTPDAVKNSIPGLGLKIAERISDILAAEFSLVQNKSGGQTATFVFKGE